MDSTRGRQLILTKVGLQDQLGWRPKEKVLAVERREPLLHSRAIVKSRHWQGSLSKAVEHRRELGKAREGGVQRAQKVLPVTPGPPFLLWSGGVEGSKGLGPRKSPACIEKLRFPFSQRQE